MHYICVSTVNVIERSYFNKALLKDRALYSCPTHLRDIAGVANFEGGNTFVEGNGLPREHGRVSQIYDLLPNTLEPLLAHLKRSRRL